MPPKGPGRPRKKNPPADASNTQTASQPQSEPQEPPSVPELPQDENEELSFGDHIQSTPKTRLRGPTKAAPVPDHSTAPSEQVSPPRRRGRRAKVAGEQKNVEQAAQEPEREAENVAEKEATPPRKRRRGDRNGAQNGPTKDDEPADTTADAPEALKRGAKKRGKASDAARAAVEKEQDEAQDVTHDEDDAPAKRKAGRPKRKLAQEEEHVQSPPPEEANGEQEQPKTKKRKLRPSRPIGPGNGKTSATKTAPEPETREDPEPEPQVDGEEEAEAETETAPRLRKKRRGRPSQQERPSETEPPTENGTATEPDPQTRKKRRRAETAEEQNEEPAKPPSPSRKYRRIAPRNISIPQSKIEETWTPLPPASINLATSLLQLAERPVLQGLSNPKRREQAAQVLRVISRSLNRRLARQFPFPPALSQGTVSGARKASAGGAGAAGAGKDKGAGKPDPREEELDYDRCLSASHALERAQDTLLHGNQLLRAELAREEAALERDYKDLETLEANARSEVRGLREALRKAHPLVPDHEGKSAARAQTKRHGREHELRVGEQRGGSGNEDKDGGEGGSALFSGFEDPELQALGPQLVSHLESMRTNLRPVEGVIPEIVQSRAALRDVLARYLDQKNFDHVVLG